MDHIRFHITAFTPVLPIETPTSAFQPVHVLDEAARCPESSSTVGKQHLGEASLQQSWYNSARTWKITLGAALITKTTRP